MGQGRNAGGGQHSRIDRHWVTTPMTAEGQASTSLFRAHPNPKPRTFRQPRCHAPQLDLTIVGRRNGDFLQWPGWPSRLIDHIAVAGLESYDRSARKTYTGYACEGSIHLSDKAPNLARRTGMPAAPLVVHKINHSALPASKQSYTPTSIMRSQLASRGSDMSDSHMKKPDLRRGWGLRRGMRIASSERHTTPPILPGA